MRQSRPSRTRERGSGGAYRGTTRPAGGTTVTVWQYSDSNLTPTHRQWMLFPLTATQLPDAIEELTAGHTSGSPSADDAIYDLSGRRLSWKGFVIPNQLPKGIYIVKGRKVIVQ